MVALNYEYSSNILRGVFSVVEMKNRRAANDGMVIRKRLTLRVPTHLMVHVATFHMFTVRRYAHANHWREV